MHSLLNRIFGALKTVLTCESAQDLVEYGLIVGVMALGTIAGTRSLAAGLGLALNNVSATMAASFH